MEYGKKGAEKRCQAKFIIKYLLMTEQKTKEGARQNLPSKN
jgi:hypothetical protein